MVGDNERSTGVSHNFIIYDAQICLPPTVIISLLVLLLPVVTLILIFCKSSMFTLPLFLLASYADISSKGDTGTGCSYILWRSTSDWLMKALPHLLHLSIAIFFYFLPMFSSVFVIIFS